MPWKALEETSLVAREILNRDWTSHPLGDPGTWPTELLTTLGMCLRSEAISAVYWGPEFRVLYNDATLPVLGDRHSLALGAPASEVWVETWPRLEPLMRRVVDSGTEYAGSNTRFAVDSQGHPTESYYNFWFTPITLGDGTVAGIYAQGRETTSFVLAEKSLGAERRRLEILNNTGAFIAAELDLDRIVQSVTDAGVELTGAQFGAFFYNVTNDAGESYMLYSLSGVPREAFSSFPMPRATAVFKPTFVGEGVVRSDDILQDRRYGHSEPYRGMPPGHLPVRSYLAVPVKSRSGEVIGGLFFGHEKTAVFDNQHETILLGIAAQAAVAIDNARLFKAAERELSQRKAAEEELRLVNSGLESRVAEEVAVRQEAELALRQAQKMEAVGQLTGGIAHDFNNIIGGVLGSLELMQSRLAQGRVSELDRFLVGAHGAAKRAAALTQRLLAFSRRQTLDPKPADLNRLVAGMQDLIARSVGPEIHVESAAAGGLWTTFVDVGQLESALLNLCINARDAMPGGGTLTIETGNRWLDERAARERGLTAGQYISLCVSDTGVGMPADVIERAFDPFFTTKPIGQGTGLGLSMVYGFAGQSNGSVRIYSEVGKGTMVCIYLPRHRGEEDASELDGAVEKAPVSLDHETILLVDDEPLIRMVAFEVLTELGYHVIEAGDGPEAMRTILSQKRIDLLVTDVGLPNGMNGRQLADSARQRRPGLQVLFVTGYAENAVLNHGHLEPGMHVLTKPFGGDDLGRRVRDLITGAQKARQ